MALFEVSEAPASCSWEEAPMPGSSRTMTNCWLAAIAGLCTIQRCVSLHRLVMS
jgi:hypothetical protein